jgi:hypothetical protein
MIALTVYINNQRKMIQLIINTELPEDERGIDLSGFHQF